MFVSLTAFKSLNWNKQMTFSNCYNTSLETTSPCLVWKMIWSRENHFWIRYVFTGITEKNKTDIRSTACKTRKCIWLTSIICYFASGLLLIFVPVLTAFCDSCLFVFVCLFWFVLLCFFFTILNKGWWFKNPHVLLPNYKG